jgi:hypothetical protein
MENDPKKLFDTYKSARVRTHARTQLYERYEYILGQTLFNIFCTIKIFYSPTDAQVNCLKNNFKIYVKIDIKTAATCFGAITTIRERTIRFAKVTVVERAN